MGHWTLNILQRETLKFLVQGKTVYDFGAGDCSLALECLNFFGAEKVVAIDKEPMRTFPKFSRGLEQRQILFKDFKSEKPIEIGLLSWAINHDYIDYVLLLKNCEIIVIIGRTTDGTMCGNKAMWEYLLTRQLLAYIPATHNSMLIYGDEILVKRQPVLEELGGLDLEKIHESV